MPVNRLLTFSTKLANCFYIIVLSHGQTFLCSLPPDVTIHLTISPSLFIQTTLSFSMQTGAKLTIHVVTIILYYTKST